MEFESKHESPYWLKPDDEERIRLNKQHRALVYIFGNKLLHAHIDPSTIIRVADVGTGTGVWLDHLATSLDSVPTATGQRRQYDGFDMTPASFPAVHPETFHYGVLNILQPVPEELKGKYDLVHIRLLAAALRIGDVATVVGNVSQLLRPGGWFQWEDLNSELWLVKNSSPYVTEINEIVKIHMEANGMELHIPITFREAVNTHPDLQNLSITPFNVAKFKPELKASFDQAFLWASVRSAKMILYASGKPNAAEEFERLNNGATADLEKGVCSWDSDMYLMLMQKK